MCLLRTEVLSESGRVLQDFVDDREGFNKARARGVDLWFEWPKAAPARQEAQCIYANSSVHLPSECCIAQRAKRNAFVDAHGPTRSSKCLADVDN